MPKTLVVDFLVWNSAPWRDQLDTAVQDYLRRSQEELTLEEEWKLLNVAMLGDPGLLFFVALDDSEQDLLGYCVLNLLPGTSASGRFVNVWQAYVWPGRARLADLFVHAYSLIASWALARGAKRLTFTTRRDSKGYARTLHSLGFEEYATIYTRGVITGESVSGGTDHRPVVRRSDGLAAVRQPQTPEQGHHRSVADAGETVPPRRDTPDRRGGRKGRYIVGAVRAEGHRRARSV